MTDSHTTDLQLQTHLSLGGGRNTFGRLKGRWRCLLYNNECDIDLVKIMVTTCALHNLFEKHGEKYDNTWDVSVVNMGCAEPVAQGAYKCRTVGMRCSWMYEMLSCYGYYYHQAANGNC